MAELVDATDLKSVEVHPRAGSIPASGTNNSCINIYNYNRINYLFIVRILPPKHVRHLYRINLKNIMYN